MEFDSIANGNSIFIFLPVVVDQQPQKTPVSCSLLSQPEVLGHEETFFCGTSSAKLPTLSMFSGPVPIASCSSEQPISNPQGGE